MPARLRPRGSARLRRDQCPEVACPTLTSRGAHIPHGVVSTPVTPFTDDNRLDLDTARRSVDFQILHGADAIALPMHTGVSIDMLAYNFPGKLGVALTGESLLELVDRLENFVGVKDASYSMQSFTEACRLTSAVRPQFAMFTGVEFLLPSMVVGGAGCFSPCSAIAPRLVRDLYEACRAGEMERAATLQHRMSALWHLLRHEYPSSVKAALGIVGRASGGVRLPLLALDPESLAKLRAGLEALGVLDAEPLGSHDS